MLNLGNRLFSLFPFLARAVLPRPDRDIPAADQPLTVLSPLSPFSLLSPRLSLSLFLTCSSLFILSVSFSVTKHEFSREANALARVTYIFRRLAGKSIVSRSECIFDLPRFTRKIFPGRPTSAGRKEGFLVVRANAEDARPRLVPFVSLRTVLIGMQGHAFVGATNQPTSQRISARSLALSFSLSPPPLSLYLSLAFSARMKSDVYIRAR